MNTDLEKMQKNDFKSCSLMMMNNAVFETTMKNVTNHRNMKLVKTEGRRDHLMSKPNYHRTKVFPESLLAIEMKRIRILMNKRVYLDLLTQETRKTVMPEF